MVNGQTVEEADLCERCAAEYGEVPPAAGGADGPLSIPQLLAGLMAGLGGAPAADPAAADRCPQCGYTYGEFARTGLLGCPGCYAAFADRLEAPIRRLHGASSHEGKVPLRSGVSLRRQRAVEELRRALQQAVERQEFERAAELRDRLRALRASG